MAGLRVCWGRPNCPPTAYAGEAVRSPECGVILASRVAPCPDGWLAGLGGGGRNVPRMRGNSSKPNCPVTPVEGHPSQDGRLEGLLGETLMSPYGLRGGGHKVPRTRGYFSKPNSPVMAVRPDGRLASLPERAFGLGGGGHKVPRMGLLFQSRVAPRWPSARTVGLHFGPKGPYGAGSNSRSPLILKTGFMSSGAAMAPPDAFVCLGSKRGCGCVWRCCVQRT